MLKIGKLKNIYLAVLIVLGVVCGFPSALHAQYADVRNAFIVSPAKQEIKLGAGESIIRNIYITNKLGYDTDFIITVEDISGSKDDAEVIKYYGDSLGPYSLRNYVMVANDRIFVASGETKVVPIMISLPSQVKLGGFYGGVFVSAVKPKDTGSTNVSTRIGSLIFLRVKGDTIEEGSVKRFDVEGGKHIIWSSRPVDFQVAFENTGNVYLNPYGIIEIRNSRGTLLDRLPIDPWFVFPDSLRTRTVSWKNVPLFGSLTATLILNHGYTTPHGTTLSYRFFIVPIWLIMGLVVLAILFYIGYQVVGKLKKWHI